MKKILALLLCMLFVFSLASCRGADEKEADGGEQPQVSSNGESSENPLIDNNIIDNSEMMTVDTSVGTLYYPKKWENQVNFSVEDKVVEAACGDVRLFSIYFGGEKGEEYDSLLVGDEVISLRYEMYDIDDSLDNFDDLCAMQDDINVIFLYLSEEGRFV